MRYNTTYHPLIDIKDTLKEMSAIKERLVLYLKQAFRLIDIPHPTHLSEDSSMQVRMDELTRTVSYDLGDNLQVVSQLLSHTNWLRSMFNKVELSNYEGFLINPRYVFRDKEISSISNTQSEYLVAQIKLPNKIDESLFYKQISKDLYSIIYEEIERLTKKYKLKKIFPKDIEFITSQMMENEYKHLKPIDRELEFVQEKVAILLEAPGRRLLSGHMHKLIPPYTFDLNNHRELLLFDLINSAHHNVAHVGILASGQLLSDQLSLYNQNELKEVDLFKEAMAKEEKILEISINLTNLFMSILQKGHISEVAPGSIDPEAKIIKERYKVEVL